MNSTSETRASLADMMDDESTSIEDDMRDIDLNQQSRACLTRSSAGSTSSTGTTTTSNGIKRQKEMPPCFVCGAKANGYNFDQSICSCFSQRLLTSLFLSYSVTCESCKAFFRRNALKSTVTHTRAHCSPQSDTLSWRFRRSSVVEITTPV